MNRKSYFITGTMLVIMIILLAPGLSAQDVKADLPVLVTSCGQCAGPVKFKAFMNRLKMEHDYNLTATADDITNGNYKSVIIVTGASLKGMGAAGVSIKEEIARAEGIIAAAREKGMTVIGAHVTGMANRSQGAAEGDNTDEMSIDAVMPVSDILVVYSDGNSDGRFSKISEAKKIPMLEFEKNAKLGGILKDLFSK